MDIVERAKIKSGMLRMGEPIKFGSDADLIDEMIIEVERFREEREQLLEYLWQIYELPEDSHIHAKVAKKALKKLGGMN